MANTENIEARLCAYVDGDLDDAGRAEIEAHLATNPQHRQLLEELRAQHALLSELPRARAPEDLSDAFQAQLERSGLLDESHATAPIAGRINRMPQIFAAAAVLLLTVGLAAVILMVLPARKNAPQVAIHSTAATSAPSAQARRSLSPSAGDAPVDVSGAATQPAARGMSSAVAEADKSADAPSERMFAKSAATPPVHGKTELSLKSSSPKSPAPNAAPNTPTPPDVFASGNGAVFASKNGAVEAGATPSQSQSYTNIFASNQQLDTAAAEKLKQLHGVPENAPIVVVASDNPASADQQVQQYLTSNNIHWEPVSEPMPNPIDLSQNQAVAPARLQNDIAMRLKASPLAQQQSAQAAPQAKDRASAPLEQKQRSTPLGGQLAKSPEKSAVSGGKQEPSSSDNLVASKPASASPAPTAELPTSMPSGAPSGSQSPASVVPQAPAQEMAQQRQIAIAPPTTQPEIVQPHVIVARGLTARQVAELSEIFSSNKIVRIGDESQTRAMNTQSTASLSGAGGIGGAAASKAGAPAATAPSAAAVPAPTIRAAGTQPAGLGLTGSVAAQSAPATPAIASPATQPLDQSARNRTLADQIEQAPSPAGKPASPLAATQPAFGQSPATQPASEAKIDVVIYVQPLSAAQQQIAPHQEVAPQQDAPEEPAVSPARGAAPPSTPPATQSAAPAPAAPSRQ